MDPQIESPSGRGPAPVNVSIAFIYCQYSWIGILEFYQLHEQVCFCQAEEGVNGGKIRLIVIMSDLHSNIDSLAQVQLFQTRHQG